MECGTRVGESSIAFSDSQCSQQDQRLTSPERAAGERAATMIVLGESLTPATRLVAGAPSCVFLDAKSPISAEARLSLLLFGPRTLRGTLTERTSTTSTIEARFTCLVAGDYRLQVEDDVTGRVLLGEPITVVPGPVHPASCELLKAPGISRTFRLQARDCFGNAHLVGGAPLEAAVGGAVGAQLCVVHDGGDGTYSITVPTDAEHGPQLLRAWLHGAPDVEVQLPVYVPRNRRLPSGCRLLDCSGGVVGAPLRLSLCLVDSDGQPCAELDAVQVFATLDTTPMEISVATQVGSRGGGAHGQGREG